MKAWWPRPAHGRRRRHLVRIDLSLPHKRHSLFDHQFGGTDIAKQLSLGLELDFVLGRHISGDFSPHDHRAGIDIAVDNRTVTQVQRAIRSDFPIELSFKSQFPVEPDVSFDFNV